jgi:hypothetical protein
MLLIKKPHIDAKSVHGLLHGVDVGDVNVSEVHSASIFIFVMCSVVSFYIRTSV